MFYCFEIARLFYFVSNNYKTRFISGWDCNYRSFRKLGEMAKSKGSPETSKHFKHKRNSFFVKNRTGFKNKSGTPRPSPAKAHNKNEETNSHFDSFFVKTASNSKPSSSSNAPYTTPNESTSNIKKPFDKKKWRLQKYSKKYKLEQWEDNRKKAVLREYYKEMKEGEAKFDVQKIYQQYEEEEENSQPNSSRTTKEETENENNLNTSIRQGQEESAEKNRSIQRTNSKSVKGKAYKKAHLEYQRLQEEKKKRKEELARKKAERDEALRIYKEKKTEKFKTLSRKTKKGQPIMKNRMEMLLEQIQKSIS